MRIARFTFGSIRIEGETSDQDVVIDRARLGIGTGAQGETNAALHITR